VGAVVVGGVYVAAYPAGAPPGAHGDWAGHSLGSSGTTKIMTMYAQNVSDPVKKIDRNQMIRTMTGSTSK
jgi:hypothetical protein